MTTDALQISAAQDLRSRLLDIDAHLDGTSPGLVHSSDGRIYAVAAMMPTGMVTMEDYPLTSPKPKLQPFALDVDLLDAGNRSLIASIQSRFDGHGQNVLTDATGKKSLARSSPVAIKAAHDFQVVWSGPRHQWFVGAGHVNYPDGDGLDSAESWLDGHEGWVVVPVSIQPSSTGIVGHSVNFEITKVGKVKLTQQPEHDPSVVTITHQGIVGSPGFTSQMDHTEGTYELPLARVRPPNGSFQTPLVFQIQRGPIAFNFDGWKGSFPEYTTL
jgi:hypothetical protein